MGALVYTEGDWARFNEKWPGDPVESRAMARAVGPPAGRGVVVESPPTVSVRSNGWADVFVG